MNDFFHSSPGMAEFRARTGFITNFMSKDHLDYQRAVAEYAKTNPEYRLRIGEPSNTACDYALYKTGGRRDLSEFWRLYETLRKERIEAKKRALNEQFSAMSPATATMLIG